MPQELKYILIAYFAIVSLISAAVTVADKLKAKMHTYRTPEAALLLLSALGGSVAMLFTMILIHHKTKHKKFMVGIPVIILVQFAILGIILLQIT